MFDPKARQQASSTNQHVRPASQHEPKTSMHCNLYKHIHYQTVCQAALDRAKHAIYHNREKLCSLIGLLEARHQSTHVHCVLTPIVDSKSGPAEAVVLIICRSPIRPQLLLFIILRG